MFHSDRCFDTIGPDTPRAQSHLLGPTTDCRVFRTRRSLICAHITFDIVSEIFSTSREGRMQTQVSHRHRVWNVSDAKRPSPTVLDCLS